MREAEKVHKMFANVIEEAKAASSTIAKSLVDHHGRGEWYSRIEF